MSLLIDDFTTGPCTIDIVTGVFPTQYQAGSMLGGGRLLSLNNVLNVRNQLAHIDIGSTNRLNLTIGAKDYVRLDIAYGFLPNGAPDKGVQVPLNVNVNLNNAGSIVRTNFNAVSGDYPINFNVLIFTARGWSQGGQNLLANPNPFSFKLPFSSFDGPGGQDFSNVSYIVFTFQTLDSLAIDSFEIV